jgi:hypothetical protein
MRLTPEADEYETSLLPGYHIPTLAFQAQPMYTAVNVLDLVDQQWFSGRRFLFTVKLRPKNVLFAVISSSSIGHAEAMPTNLTSMSQVLDLGTRRGGSDSGGEGAGEGASTEI